MEERRRQQFPARIWAAATQKVVVVRVVRFLENLTVRYFHIKIIVSLNLESEFLVKK